MLLVSGKGVILDLNIAFCRCFDICQGDVRGTTLISLVASQPHHLQSYLRDCSRSRSFHLGTLDFKSQTGDPVKCRCEGALLKPWTDGKPAEILIRFRPSTSDSTLFARLNRMLEDLKHQVGHQKRTELTLRETITELESFSYSISHDLRSPLRAINYYSNVAATECGELPEEAKRCLLEVHKSSTRMNQLIDDLLAFSRLSRDVVRREPVDMSEIILSNVQSKQLLTEGREVEFVYGNIPKVSADRTLLDRLWDNLVSNAVKYSSVRERAVIEFGSFHENRETVFFVRDNGAGFPMKYADRLFRVFERLHSESKFEGTGIGLAIVKQVVAKHGGRVWAEGEVDRGATFYFTLAPPQSANAQLPEATAIAKQECPA